MSDFLSRIATRAVGGTAVPRPVRPGPSEPGGHPGLGIVEREVVVTPPGRGDADEPTTPTPRPVAREPRVEGTRPTPEPATRPVDVEARSTPSVARPSADVAAIRAVEPDDRAAGPTGSQALAPGGDPAPASIAAAASTPPAPTALARPVPSIRELGRPAASRQTPEHDEPPSVLVHIGRLEVRANLQEAPPPRRPQEEPPAAGPSLADYLRGKRETG